MFCEDQTSYDQTALESISVWNPLPQAQQSKRVNHTPEDSKRADLPCNRIIGSTQLLNYQWNSSDIDTCQMLKYQSEPQTYIFS